MKVRLFLLYMTVILSFTGCFEKYKEIETTTIYQSASLQKTLANKKAKNQDTKDVQDTIINRLYTFYKEWKGTKYKYGGITKKGIDCSALIQIAYKELFSLSIPRTTLLQSRLGEDKSKKALQSGDLVFFKNRGYRHVGIYLENGKFLHASTKKGVTISRLDNVYFKKNYWKAIKLL